MPPSQLKPAAFGLGFLADVGTGKDKLVQEGEPICMSFVTQLQVLSPELYPCSMLRL